MEILRNLCAKRAFDQSAGLVLTLKVGLGAIYKRNAEEVL